MCEKNDYDLIANNITEFVTIFLDRISFGYTDKIYTKQRILLLTCRDLIGEYAMNYGNIFIKNEAEEIIKEITDYIEIIIDKENNEERF